MVAVVWWWWGGVALWIATIPPASASALLWLVIYGKQMENLLLLISTEWEVLVVVIRGRRWSTQAGFAVAVEHRGVVGQGVPCWHRISSRHPLRAVTTSLNVHNPEGTWRLFFVCVCFMGA